MKVSTRSFGEMEVSDGDIIRFPQGMPGFEHLRRFVVVDSGDGMPFSFLQSVDDGDISFVALNPFTAYRDYEFDLPPSTSEELQIEDPQEAAVFTIVSFGNQMSDMTVNLLAPIVINTKERIGKQVILHNTEYRTKHSLPLSELTGLSEAKG